MNTTLQWFRTAFESAPSGLLVCDDDGTIVLVNREIERISGYRRGELLGEAVETLAPDPETRAEHPRWRASYMRAPAARAMGSGRDLRARRKDGTLVPVEIGLNPFATDDGTFVVSTVVDITERRRAEERLRSLVEHSPCGMVVVDAEGRIVQANRELERLTGYAHGELVGQSVEALVPRRLRGAHPDARRRYTERPVPRQMGVGRDLFALRRDGSEVPVEIGLNPIVTEEGSFVLGSIVDVSARKRSEEVRARLEAELRQSQKMVAVGTVASGIAHDFNNVLTAIVGYAELVQMRHQDDERSATDLADLLAIAERGRRMIERILRFSRRDEPRHEPVQVTATLEEIGRSLRATLPPTVHLRLDLAPDLPSIQADPTSLHQIVTNLATNAAQAMPEGGELTVSAGPAYVHDHVARQHPSLAEGMHLALAVTDHGEGIPSDRMERIFEPFFTTKPAGSGSGLGLAMVRTLVHELRGSVEVESQVGAGTTVRCYFPVTRASAEQDPPAPAPVPRAGAARVLFVDDEPAIADVGRRRLEVLGYSVVAATSAEQAMRLLRFDPGGFDVLVTDLSMPDVSGLELARRARALVPTLPVLLLSGDTTSVNHGEARAAGVVRILAKPLSLAELGEAVASAVPRGATPETPGTC